MVFLAQGTLLAEIATLRTTRTDDETRRVAELGADPGSLLVSAAAASVNDSHRGTSGKVLIHIQDAHTNLSAQKNLATILDEIITQYGVDLVFVEGGTGNDSLSFLREYAEPETRRRTAARFLERGEISGEEYLDITSEPDKPFLLWGIEDPDLYEKSLVSYAQIVDIRKAANAYLDRVGRAVKAVRPRIYPHDLLEFEKKASEFRKTRIPFTDYYEYLAASAAKGGVDLAAHPDFARLGEIRELEKTVDFKKADAEQGEVVKLLARREPILAELAQSTDKLKFGRAPVPAFYDMLAARMKEQGMEPRPNLDAYMRYVRAFGALDMPALLKDFEAIEDASYARYEDKPDVRRLHEISRYVDILRNYYSLKLKPSEFAVYKKNIKNFQSSEWIAYLNRKLMDFGRHGEVVVFDPILDDRQAEVESFYRTIESRDYAFVDRAFKKMEETGRNTAVLICGGYHTPHLKELLKEKQSSYVVVTPHVADETDIENYERVLLGSLDPTKRWVVTAREGTVRPRRAAELRGVVPEVQENLIRNDGLYGKPFAGAVQSLQALSQSAEGVQRGRFGLIVDPDETLRTIRVTTAANGRSFVLRPEASERRLFDADAPWPTAIASPAALGSRYSSLSDKDRYDMLKERWNETSTHGNHTDIFVSMARQRLDQGDYRSAILAALLGYRIATKPGHDSIPVSLVLQVMTVRDSVLSYMTSEAIHSLDKGEKDPAQYDKAIELALFILDLGRIAKVELYATNAMPQQWLDDAGRILATARQRYLAAEEVELADRFAGTLQSHAQRARYQLELGRLHFGYGKPEAALYHAELAVTTATEPGHDSIPSDVVIAAKELISKIKERLPKAPEGTRLPPETAARIETVLTGSGVVPGLMLMAQDRAFARSGAQDELLSAVNALVTAITDGRGAESAFIDLTAAGEFIDRAGKRLRGNAVAVRNLQIHASAVRTILIGLSIALGDLDDASAGFTAPTPNSLAASYAGRLYVLLHRLRRLLGDQAPAVLPDQVLRNVFDYPDLPVTDSNRDNDTWQDDFLTEVQHFVESSLAVTRERELIDEDVFQVLNAAIRRELGEVHDSFTEPSPASFVFAFGHVQGWIARIQNEMAANRIRADRHLTGFQLAVNQLANGDVESIRELMPAVTQSAGNEPEAVSEALGSISTLLGSVAVNSRRVLLRRASFLTYATPELRDAVEMRIVQVSKAAATARQIAEVIRATGPGSRNAVTFADAEIQQTLVPLALDAVSGIELPPAGESRDIRLEVREGVTVKVVASTLDDGSVHVEIFSPQAGAADKLLRVMNVSAQANTDRRETLKRKAALAQVEAPAAGTAVATALETAGGDWQKRDKVRNARTDYLASARAVERALEAVEFNPKTPVVVTVPLEAFKDFAGFDGGKNYDALLRLFLLEAAHLRSQPAGGNISFAPDTRDGSLLTHAAQVIESLKSDLRAKAESDAELKDQWLELLAPLDAIAADLTRGPIPQGTAVVNLFNAEQAGRPVTGSINIPVKLNAAGVRAGKTGMEVPPIRAILNLGVTMARAGISAMKPQDIPRPFLNAWQTLLGEPIAPKDAVEFGSVVLGLVTDVARVLRFALPPAVRIDFDSLFQFIDAIARFA